MSTNVDAMSDAELRTKLAENGFPVMPITASTRKLLIKKLKLVLDNKADGRNANTNSSTARRATLAKYSSGEDSDLEQDIGRGKRVGRRATTGPMPPPAPAVSRARRPTPKKDSPNKANDDNDKGSESEEEEVNVPIKTREEVETVTTRRITRMYKNGDREEYETGSDSDVDVDRKTSMYRSDSRSSDYISSTIPAAEVVTSSPPRTSLLSSRPISGGHTSLLSNPESLTSIRARLGLSSTFADRLSATRPSTAFTSTYKSTGSDEIESPYLSDFARRLTTLKSDPPRATLLADRDNNGGAAYSRKPYVSSVSRSNVIDYKSSADRRFLKSNYVSLALVVIVALFFFFLFSVYLVRKNDVTAIVDEKNSVFPICQLNIPGNRPGINCVPKEQVSYAKNLLKLIRPELASRAAAFKCQEPEAVPFLTDREIIEMASNSALHDDADQIRTDLNNLQVLIVNNPQWGLSIVEMKDIYSQGSEHTTLKKMDEVVKYRNKGNVAIMVTDPSTPISCLLFNTFYSAVITTVLLGLVIAIGFGSHKLVLKYNAYRKQKQEEIYSLVEQIIDIISQEHEDNGEAFMSVDHVRDMLISPQNRDKMSSTWDAAVEFIKKNESRVRMELHAIDGEECQAWRWVSNRPGSPRSSGTAWQGQAFETQEGSVNNLAVSPTPCLKIRYMFDKNDTNDDLRSVIQDAILEKCGDQCKILHIDLDRASCCVYVKCASQKDAGIVYKSLHGWWYEGRLITVKYLRLERYMVRFPNSPSMGSYLTISRQRNSTWNN